MTIQISERLVVRIYKSLALSVFAGSVMLSGGEAKALAAAGLGPWGPPVASLVAYLGCIRGGGGGPAACRQAAMIIDPVVPAGLLEIKIGLEYDSSLFTFNQSQSGPLAPFGTGGSVFTESASSGTMPPYIRFIDSDPFTPATLFADSTLSYDIAANSVEAVLTYNQPGLTITSANQNFFMFVFDSPTDLDPTALYTYNAPTLPDQEGPGPRCYSDTPIAGVELPGGSIDQSNFSCRFNTVPGPLPIFGVGAFLGFSRKLRKKIKTSKMPENMSAIV
jgi:hypothetical protein